MESIYEVCYADLQGQMGLELYVGRKIGPHHSLLIFDEVQEVPRALTSLKYFMKMRRNIIRIARQSSAICDRSD